MGVVELQRPRALRLINKATGVPLGALSLCKERSKN
jgi:hypothetical protein